MFFKKNEVIISFITLQDLLVCRRAPLSDRREVAFENYHNLSLLKGSAFFRLVAEFQRSEVAINHDHITYAGKM